MQMFLNDSIKYSNNLSVHTLTNLWRNHINHLIFIFLHLVFSKINGQQ